MLQSHSARLVSCVRKQCDIVAARESLLQLCCCYEWCHNSVLPVGREHKAVDAKLLDLHHLGCRKGKLQREEGAGWWGRS